jgi:nitrate reductase NapE component
MNETGTNAPKSKHQLIRLLACVICSCVVLGFTVSYTNFEIEFYSHIWINGTAFPEILDLVCDYGRWTFAIPLICLIIGLWLLYKHPESLAIFEFLIFCIWLLTIIVVGYWFLAWQLQLNHLIWSDQTLMKPLLPHSHAAPGSD